MYYWDRNRLAIIKQKPVYEFTKGIFFLLIPVQVVCLFVCFFFNYVTIMNDEKNML